MKIQKYDYLRSQDYDIMNITGRKSFSKGGGIVANATLEKMREIEQEAQEILLSYQEQIDALKKQKERELHELATEKDKEIQEALKKLEQSFEEKRQLAKADLKATRIQNEKSLKETLLSQKEELVTAIVEKVVKRYGH